MRLLFKDIRYANEWKQATDVDYQALIDNKTWELVKPNQLDANGFLR